MYYKTLSAGNVVEARIHVRIIVGGKRGGFGYFFQMILFLLSEVALFSDFTTFFVQLTKNEDLIGKMSREIHFEYSKHGEKYGKVAPKKGNPYFESALVMYERCFRIVLRSRILSR